MAEVLPDGHCFFTALGREVQALAPKLPGARLPILHVSDGERKHIGLVWREYLLEIAEKSIGLNGIWVSWASALKNAFKVMASQAGNSIYSAQYVKYISIFDRTLITKVRTVRNMSPSSSK